jgi:hypothetical protein
MQRSTLVLSLVTIASLMGNVWLYLGQHAGTANLSAAASPASQTASNATATTAPAEARIKDLEAQLKQAKDILKRYNTEKGKPITTSTSAAPTTASTSNSTAKPAEKAKDLKEMLGSMMNDPAMRDFAVQQQISQLENKYAGLMDHLQLSPEEKIHFKKLLSERIQQQTQAGVKLMQPNLSKEQQKQIVGELTDSKNASDKAIEQFMNHPTDYQTFKHWEDTQAERDMLQVGKTAFDSTGTSLTPQQESQLIDLMYEARSSNLGNLPDIYNTKAMLDTQITDQFIKQLNEKNLRDQQFIMQKASSFLSQQQLPALQKFLQEQARLYEATLKMARQMMN